MAKTAIEASRINAFSIDPNEVKIVGLDTDDGPDHPLYDARAAAPLDEAMVLRMRRKGWTHGAAEVRKNGDKLEVVVGRQRIKCLREANRLRHEEDGLGAFKARVFVKQIDGADALELLVAENEQRRADHVLLKAEKAKRLLDMGSSEDDVCQAFGVQAQTIKNWLRFFDLAPEVQKAVRSGKASFYAVLALAELDRDAQVSALAEIGYAGAGEGEEAEISAGSVRKAVKRAKGAEDIERPGMRKIKRVLAANAEEEFLSRDFAKALRWVLGEIGDSAIAGVTRATKEQA